MNIINTISNIDDIFISGHFDLSEWKKYMDLYIPGAKEICLKDMIDCQRAGYTWEKNYLLILDGVYNDLSKIERVVNAFAEVTQNLNDRIYEVFNRTLDVDIYLYLGLCNGAGWVTEVSGKTTILLGIEKIIELGWYDIDSMNALILHELGHVYQKQYGLFKITTNSEKDSFLWQLFTEGVAMVFEQEILGNFNYFHQDKDNWRNWCESNIELIIRSFCDDLNTMTRDNQRYFGDWVSFENHSDVGYYLGTRFVRFMMKDNSFDSIINYGLDKIKEEFDIFIGDKL